MQKGSWGNMLPDPLTAAYMHTYATLPTLKCLFIATDTTYFYGYLPPRLRRGGGGAVEELE